MTVFNSQLRLLGLLGLVLIILDWLEGLLPPPGRSMPRQAMIGGNRDFMEAVAHDGTHTHVNMFYYHKTSCYYVVCCYWTHNSCFWTFLFFRDFLLNVGTMVPIPISMCSKCVLHPNDMLFVVFSFVLHELGSHLVRGKFSPKDFYVGQRAKDRREADVLSLSHHEFWWCDSRTNV